MTGARSHCRRLLQTAVVGALCLAVVAPWNGPTAAATPGDDETAQIEAARADAGPIPRSCPYDKLNAAYPPAARTKPCHRFAGTGPSWRWTVHTLRAGGAQLGALTLQPLLREDVPNCLLREGLHSTACDSPTKFDRLTNPLNAYVRDIRLVYRHVRSVTVTGLVCPGHVCAAVQRRHIVFRDRSHVTATASRKRSWVLADILRDRGLL